jgi:hypothetical protein
MDAETRDILLRLDAVERRIADQPQRPAAGGERARFFFARIVNESGSGDEPELCGGDCAARKWPIEFVDATFDETAGISDLTVTTRSETVYYMLAPLSLTFLVGTVVSVERKNGRWWYLQQYGLCTLDGQSGSGGGCSGDFCPPGSVPVEVLTGYQCVSGVAIPCTRTICLPAGTLVSATECTAGGGATAGGTVGAFDCEVSESLLLTLELSGCSCGASLEIALAWNGAAWTGSAVLGSCPSVTITATFYETSPNSNIGILELTSNGHGGANWNNTYVCTGGSLSIDDDGPNESVNGWCTGGTWTGFTIEEA